MLFLIDWICSPIGRGITFRVWQVWVRVPPYPPKWFTICWYAMTMWRSVRFRPRAGSIPCLGMDCNIIVMNVFFYWDSRGKNHVLQKRLWWVKYLFAKLRVFDDGSASARIVPHRPCKDDTLAVFLASFDLFFKIEMPKINDPIV